MSCNISIIIPMYNSEKTILDTLSGLEDQTRKDFEVIVVDDGSTDASPKLVEQFKEKTHLSLRLVRQENAGPAKARNRGVESSQGKIIIFLDSDCIPPKNWVEEMTLPLRENIVGSNCGYRVKNKDSIVARYVDYEMAKRHEKMVGKHIDTLGGYSACLLREIFMKVGGFDTAYTTSSGEDFDLAFRITKMGYRLVFVDKTFVYHYHPDSLKRYLRQQFYRGCWRVRMYLKSKDRILNGDSYTGHEAQVQFVLSSLVFLSLPLMIVGPSVMVTVCLGALLLSNVPLGLWASQREKKFLLIAPLLASVRSLAGTLGAYAYLLRRVFV